MVGEDRFRAVASPAVGGLAHVLKHREELHALAGAGRGDLVEVRERRDVRRLIQREQQRWLHRFAGLGGALERARGDVGEQRREQPAQATLVIRRGDQIQGVRAVQQPAGADLAVADRRRRDAQLLPGVKHGRDGLQQA